MGDAADDVLATAFCTHHMPALENFTLFVEEKRVPRARSLGCYRSSPYYANGACPAMYKILNAFFSGIHWLKLFEWDKAGQWEFEEDDA